MKESEKHASYSDRILEELQRAGDTGCLNVDLWPICHAVNSRISDLRQRGFTIDSKRESASVYRYTLRPTPPAVDRPLGAQEALPF